MEILLSKIWTFIISIGLGIGMLFLGAFILVMIFMIAGVLKDKSSEGTGSARDLGNQAQKDHYARRNSNFSASEEEKENNQKEV